MRILFLASAVLFGMFAHACVPLVEDADDPANANLPPCDWADVVRVTDGDTIVVDLDGEEERVRYIGIDTPETGGSAGVEPFGKEAAALNKKLVEGARICLEKDVSETDRFGRLLRHPWLADGRLVSEVIVADGLAEVVTFPPDEKYQESVLFPAEAEARAARRGMWK